MRQHVELIMVGESITNDVSHYYASLRLFIVLTAIALSSP